jgi:prolipoprotein diacylglyceryltransferase
MTSSASHLPLHFAFEWLAYFVGGTLYWRMRERSAFPAAAWEQLAILSGVTLGALFGSKLLYWLNYWDALQAQPLAAWLGGKTIVGALLGGLLGVELAKAGLGWKTSTGDSFVWPLLAGIAIGRVGCQLSGVEDLTYGAPTGLPWGWDYGDGIPRHPTAIYEILGLGLIALALRFAPFLRQPGDRFRGFMVTYLALRLGLDGLKPPHVPPSPGALQPMNLLSLSAIQWACIAGMLYYARSIHRWLTERVSIAHA